MLKNLIKSIDSAFNEKSKINDQILSIKGLSTPKVRHLLNNICSFDGVKYLEVGSFMGSTLCSASFKNNGKFYGVENFSEIFGFGKTSYEIKKELFENVDSLKQDNITIIEKNLFDNNISIQEKINVYFYDGQHTLETQYYNLLATKQFLDNRFIYLVDDWFCDVSFAKNQTFRAIKDFNFEIETYIELPKNDFHHGIGCFILKNH